MQEKTAGIWIAPILPEKDEAWRRLCQQFMASRRQQYVASRERLGVLRETSWLASIAQTDLAVVCWQAPAPYMAWQKFLASKRPFARWYHHQLQSILGVRTGQLLGKHRNEQLHCWQTEESGR